MGEYARINNISLYLNVTLNPSPTPYEQTARTELRELRPEVGKVTLKSNDDEELNNESL
jgi:hypothetical protein